MCTGAEALLAAKIAALAAGTAASTKSIVAKPKPNISGTSSGFDFSRDCPGCLRIP